MSDIAEREGITLLMKMEPNEDQQVELLTSFIYVWMTEDRRTMRHTIYTTQPASYLNHDFSKFGHQTCKREGRAKETGQRRVVNISAIMFRIVDRVSRGQNEWQKEQKNNTRDSNVVPHRSTNLARQCLTSLSRREAVLSLWYGRSCRIGTIQTLQTAYFIYLLCCSAVLR